MERCGFVGLKVLMPVSISDVSARSAGQLPLVESHFVPDIPCFRKFSIAQFKMVQNRFLGMRDWGFLKGEIWE